MVAGQSTTTATNPVVPTLAKGSAGDMAAKRASAIMGAKGVDPNSQKIFEQFSKTIFKSGTGGRFPGIPAGDMILPLRILYSERYNSFKHFALAG
jgi:hypothetical protein